MNFQNADANPGRNESKPVANENAGARAEHTPAPPHQRPVTPILATRGDIRTMVILATEGAIDLWVGHKGSPNLDRFETLHEKHAASLATYPETVGGKDLGFLLRRARATFKEFGETLQREVIEGSLPGCLEKKLDVALETVKDSAVAAAASLASIELALPKG